MLEVVVLEFDERAAFRIDWQTCGVGVLLLVTNRTHLVTVELNILQLASDLWYRSTISAEF